MEILSWDVGIKNLAYCILKKEDDNFIIKKWGVINLSENTKVCQYTTRNGDKCGKTAQFEIYNNENIIFCEGFGSSIYICKAHKEKIITEFEKKPTKLKCLKCKKDGTNVLKSCNEYNWCDDHYEKGKEQFMKKIKTKKVSGTSCMKQSLQIMASKLFSILDKDEDFIKVDKVLIENQPTMKNPTMKTISSILYSYFVIRGMTDKDRTKSNINEIKFVSPSNKLKVNKETTETVLEDGKKTDNVYKFTKKLGVKYCQSLISDKDATALSEHKKKDDMCDAFLQGFQYLFDPIPAEYLKKLKKVGFDISTPKKKGNKNQKVKSDISTSDEKVI